MCQNSVNTGHTTKLGLKTNLLEYLKIICIFKGFSTILIVQVN